MYKTKFISDLKDALELEDKINENSALLLSSLATLIVISLIDEKFDIQIRASELGKVNSVKTLMELIGLEKFEE